jgi:DNA ligase (NAD+)
MVKSPADLYGLDEAALAAVTLSGKKVGTSTAKRVMKNLNAKKELRIADFVGSLGIDMWGRSMTQTIVDAGLDTLEKMEDATVKEIAAISGVGDTKAVKFVEGFRRARKLMDELVEAGVRVKKPITGGKLSGISFCFTGIRDPAFADEILEAGGSVKNSVGKGLTYLVAKDPKSTSGKAKKARAQGTEVISLEEAKALL